MRVRAALVIGSGLTAASRHFMAQERREMCAVLPPHYHIFCYCFFLIFNLLT